VLGPVLHVEHRQRHLSALRSVRRASRLPHRPRPSVVLRLARLHQQFPQPGHLHHLQRRVPTSLQAPTSSAVPAHRLLTAPPTSHVPAEKEAACSQQNTSMMIIILTP